MLAYALALAVSSYQSAGDLVFLGATRTEMMLIEPASIRREGEFILFDEIVIMAVPESFYGGRMTRAKRFHYRADCITNSFQVTGFRLLDGTGTQLADHSAGGPVGDMMRAPRGSVADKAIAMACSGELPDHSEFFADVPAAITAFYTLTNPHPAGPTG